MATGNENSTQAVVERHWKALLARDIDGATKDYASDAVVFLPTGSVKGANAIRAYFETSMRVIPQDAFANFKFVKQDFDGEYAYTLYSAAPIFSFAGDMFHVRNGKIVAQCGVTPPM